VLAKLRSFARGISAAVPPEHVEFVEEMLAGVIRKLLILN
jgi:hypothetical protein